MRKEMRNQIRVNSVYGKDIKVANEKAKNLNRTTFQGQRVSEETNNQILALKAKHEAEKFNFEKKIKDLEEDLKKYKQQLAYQMAENDNTVKRYRKQIEDGK